MQSKLKVGLLVLVALGATACAHRTTATATNAVEGATGAQSGQNAPGSAADFAASASDRVFFDYDQHVLRADARRALEAQAAWLQRYPNVRITVAGNCDERGTREYNIALGARRAAAARDYLVSLGVSASRIQTISYGKDRPVDARPSEEGWSVNRNAHTQLVNASVS